MMIIYSNIKLDTSGTSSWLRLPDECRLPELRSLWKQCWTGPTENLRWRNGGRNCDVVFFHGNNIVDVIGLGGEGIYKFCIIQPRLSDTTRRCLNNTWNLNLNIWAKSIQQSRPVKKTFKHLTCSPFDVFFSTHQFKIMKNQFT